MQHLKDGLLSPQWLSYNTGVYAQCIYVSEIEAYLEILANYCSVLILNIRVTRFQTRYKLLRNEKHFDEAKFKEDLGGVPFE